MYIGKQRFLLPVERYLARFQTTAYARVGNPCLLIMPPVKNNSLHKNPGCCYVKRERFVEVGVSQVETA